MNSKVCRTYNGLIKAINNGEENVVLKYKDKIYNKLDKRYTLYLANETYVEISEEEYLKIATYLENYNVSGKLEKYFDGLPEECYARGLCDGTIVKLLRGRKGFLYVYDSNGKTVDELNSELGVTKAQMRAMEFGSMLSWSSAMANPKNYDENGDFIFKA